MHLITITLACCRAMCLCPVLSVEVHVASTCVGAVFSCLAHHGGCITSDEVVGCGTSGDLDPVHARHVVQATMPAALSFGLSTDLQSATSGKAFPQCQFLRWVHVLSPGARTERCTFSAPPPRPFTLVSQLLHEVLFSRLHTGPGHIPHAWSECCVLLAAA